MSKPYISYLRSKLQKYLRKCRNVIEQMTNPIETSKYVGNANHQQNPFQTSISMSAHGLTFPGWVPIPFHGHQDLAFKAPWPWGKDNHKLTSLTQVRTSLKASSGFQSQKLSPSSIQVIFKPQVFLQKSRLPPFPGIRAAVASHVGHKDRSDKSIREIPVLSTASSLPADLSQITLLHTPKISRRNSKETTTTTAKRVLELRH